MFLNSSPNNNFHSKITKCLLVVLQAIKPTVLIGSSGVGRTFTKDVIQSMATYNEVSIRVSFYKFLLPYIHSNMVWI